MAHVFISYMHEDGDFATVVKQRIEKAGFRVWMDDNLLAGEEWREMIDRAIRDSAALVVVMSPEARQSEYVTYEWAYALGSGVPVIPILLRKADAHPRLDVLHFLDFTNRRGRPWSMLIDRLEKLDIYDTPTPDQIAHQPTDDVINLLDQLRSRDWFDRRDAAQLLGERRDSVAVPRLAWTLASDRSVRVRQAAARALGWIGDESAIPDLSHALHDDHTDVSDAAAEALLRIGSDEARSALKGG